MKDRSGFFSMCLLALTITDDNPQPRPGKDRFRVAPIGGAFACFLWLALVYAAYGEAARLEDRIVYLGKHANQLLANPKVQVSVMLLPNIYAAKDLKRQVEGGGNFSKFALRYSIDERSRAKGGDLGPYRKGLLEPEVEPLIPSLSPGVVSDPIKTDKGYYLIKVSPLEPEILQADQAIRERLRQELLAEKRRKRLDDIFAELRTGATIRLADAARYVTDDPARP